jgi:segregation and condensation protein A
MVTAPSSTPQVSVGGYSGRFDVLVQAASRREVDVADIPIAAITDNFVAAISEAGGVDLDGATGFLELAAALVELKASRLLPHDAVETELPETPGAQARDLLYARLLDYLGFKQLAKWVSAHLDADDALVARGGRGRMPPEAELLADSSDAAPVDADELSRTASGLLARQRPSAVQAVQRDDREVMTDADAESLVTDRLAQGGAVAFTELVAECRHLGDVVACFVALLELYRRGALELSQPAAFASVQMAAKTAGPGELDEPGASGPSAESGEQARG